MRYFIPDAMLPFNHYYALTDDGSSGFYVMKEGRQVRILTDEHDAQLVLRGGNYKKVCVALLRKRWPYPIHTEMP